MALWDTGPWTFLLATGPARVLVHLNSFFHEQLPVLILPQNQTSWAKNNLALSILMVFLGQQDFLLRGPVAETLLLTSHREVP